MSKKVGFTDGQPGLLAISLIFVTETGVVVPGITAKFVDIPVVKSVRIKAKTSEKPGKTQLINHFKINLNWFLVDLPGYGYARVSKKTKDVFQQFITDYFETRHQLVCAFVLIIVL